METFLYPAMGVAAFAVIVVCVSLLVSLSSRVARLERANKGFMGVLDSLAEVISHAKRDDCDH